LGASGFIGGHVVRALSASDWAIPVAASRRGIVQDCTGTTQKLTLDACDPAALYAALKGADAVVNCVAGSSESIVSGARALFDSCAKLGTQPRVVHMSTISTYGTATGLVDETAELRGDWDPYARAKVEAERLAASCTSVVHLRPGIVYGPGSTMWTERVGRLLIARRLGDLGVAGQGYCNLVHVDDVVTATMSALQMCGIEGEAFNLASPVPPTWNEYFERFATALGVPFRRIGRPRLLAEQFVMAPALKAAGIAAGMSNLSWRLPELIPPGFVRLCGHPLRLDASKAEHTLGIRWKELTRGLKESAAWLRGIRLPIDLADPPPGT
jgi:nucleoside-diphosphate-sugar epimerase